MSYPVLADRFFTESRPTREFFAQWKESGPWGPHLIPVYSWDGILFVAICETTAVRVQGDWCLVSANAELMQTLWDELSGSETAAPPVEAPFEAPLEIPSIEPLTDSASEPTMITANIQMDEQGGLVLKDETQVAESSEAPPTAEAAASTENEGESAGESLQLLSDDEAKISEPKTAATATATAMISLASLTKSTTIPAAEVSISIPEDSPPAAAPASLATAQTGTFSLESLKASAPPPPPPPVQQEEHEPAPVQQMMPPPPPRRQKVGALDTLPVETQPKINLNSPPPPPPKEVLASDELTPNPERKAATPAASEKKTAPKTLGPLNDWDHLWAHLLKTFEHSLVLIYDQGMLVPLKWDPHLKREGTGRGYDVQKPSPFRIVARTQKSFHGPVVKNDSTDALFREWNEGAEPAHLSLAPVIIEDSIKGILVGWGMTDLNTKDTLETIENSAKELAKLIQKKPEILKAS